MMRTSISKAFSLLLFILTSMTVFMATSYAQDSRRVISRQDAVYDSVMRRLIGRHIDTTSSQIARHIDTIKVLRNWAKLRKGLSQEEVRKLLGSPVMIEQDLENAWIIWTYDGRTVAFNAVTTKLSHWDAVLLE